jgi:hypothetical protein
VAEEEPFMSMWLSGAPLGRQLGARADRRRSQAPVDAAINHAARDVFSRLGRRDDRRLGREAEEEALGEWRSDALVVWPAALPSQRSRR